MTQTLINVGTSPNNGQGSPLRTAFQITNANFTEAYGWTVGGLVVSANPSASALKSALSLGNVDNTSDVNKPVSTAQQSALDLKAALSSPAFTGTPTAPTAAPGTNTIQLATTAFVIANAGSIPQNSQSAAYTAVLADSGKCIFHPASDNNARTFTIPANASVAYPVGTVLEFINRAAAAVTIAITTDTLTWSPTGTTGSRTLAQYGVATAQKIGTTEWILTGTGLT